MKMYRFTSKLLSLPLAANIIMGSTTINKFKEKSVLKFIYNVHCKAAALCQHLSAINNFTSAVRVYYAKTSVQYIK